MMLSLKTNAIFNCTIPECAPQTRPPMSPPHSPKKHFSFEAKKTWALFSNLRFRHTKTHTVRNSNSFLETSAGDPVAFQKTLTLKRLSRSRCFTLQTYVERPLATNEQPWRKKSTNLATMSPLLTMKNKGFGHLKTRLFTIKTSKHVGLGGPWYFLLAPTTF